MLILWHIEVMITLVNVLVIWGPFGFSSWGYFVSYDCIQTSTNVGYFEVD